MEASLENDTVHIIIKERPNEAIINEAIDLFSTTFTDDPPAVMFSGGDPSRMPHLGRAVLAPLGGGTAHVYAATDPDGALVGVSFWRLPGKPKGTAAEKQKSSLTQYLDGLPDDLRPQVDGALQNQIPELVKTATGADTAKLDSYECEMMVIRPDHQGHGIAKAMFEIAKHKADAMGAKMLLWTGNERNVKIFEKFGMESKASTDIHTTDGSWTAHVLTRDPISA